MFATPLVLCGAIVSLSLVVLRVGAASADGPNDQASARLQYARAYVALTNMELQIAQARNQQIPNTIPKAVILGLKDHVAMSQVWLREAESREAGKPYNVALEMAQILSREADEQYAKGIQINAAVGLDPQQLDLLRIKAELARLRVATAKQIDVNSPAALVQFQVERLREEVAELMEHRVHIGDID
jgi:hypothetical protein